MRLFLIGYMGSGKSTLGKALADQLSYEFLDMDAYIEEEQEMSINQIFEKYGENEFRVLEQNALTELATKENCVISTGGGTPCFENNMTLINKLGTSFYLYLPHGELTQRLLTAKEDRPIIKNLSNDELLTFVDKHINEREKHYFQASFILNGNQSTDDLIKDIKSFLK